MAFLTLAPAASNSPWFSALPFLLAAATFTWLLSLPLRNVAIVDALWSLMFFMAGVVYALNSDPRAPRLALVLWLLALWAARLAVYITRRNAGKGEDRRYQEIRERNQPGFAVKSLYLVFWLQALLAWVISLPLLGAFASNQPLGLLDLAAWRYGAWASPSRRWVTGSCRVSRKIPPMPTRSWTAACGGTRATLTISASSASGGGSDCLALVGRRLVGGARTGCSSPVCCCAFRGSGCWKPTSAIVGRNMPTTS